MGTKRFENRTFYVVSLWYHIKMKSSEKLKQIESVVSLLITSLTKIIVWEEKGT